ncbi:hypothetical protein H1230_12465 [Paenibacillus sp. 19GGS1-52]|uniref:hypothetical protein n=1 Tax=Paenibacillus sp. 19GGS1-52 TaxID=2758563 RepID=UPI001EFB23B0|nr:hypothetical protein [Paenibacillus sp. 19GGS1-52]ULO09510.1 hypothetical protein H1230_12465 [Paenibacillus sp. 19GGS1-52]
MSIKTQAMIIGLFTGIGIPALVWLLFDEWSVSRKIIYTIFGVAVGFVSHYMAMHTKSDRK